MRKRIRMNSESSPAHISLPTHSKPPTKKEYAFRSTPLIASGSKSNTLNNPISTYKSSIRSISKLRDPDTPSSPSYPHVDETIEKLRKTIISSLSTDSRKKRGNIYIYIYIY